MAKRGTVSVSGNTLTLEGTMSAEETEEKGNYYRSEISHGAFQAAHDQHHLR